MPEQDAIEDTRRAVEDQVNDALFPVDANPIMAAVDAHALAAADAGFAAAFGERRHIPKWVGPHDPTRCGACRLAALRDRLAGK